MSLSLNWQKYRISLLMQNIIFINAKYYIYKCKRRNIALSFFAFIKNLKYQILLEKEGKNLSNKFSGNGKSRNLGIPEASSFVQRCRDTSGISGYF